MADKVSPVPYDELPEEYTIEERRGLPLDMKFFAFLKILQEKDKIYALP